MGRRSTLLAVTAVVVLCAACGGGSPSTPSNTASTGVRLPATPDALPTFDLAAYRTLIASLRGKPVVVNIWASWCGPCTAEAPELAKVSRQTQGQVQFVGIDIIDQRAPARRFIKKYGWTYPSVFDPTGAIRDGLGLLGQPDTIVYDAQGQQVFSWPGPIDAAALTKELDALRPA